MKFMRNRPTFDRVKGRRYLGRVIYGINKFNRRTRRIHNGSHCNKRRVYTGLKYIN